VIQVPTLRTKDLPNTPLKRLFLVGVLAACTLTGCRTYLVRLDNNDTITATTKPRLDRRGFYVFKDAAGREVRINETKVRQIEAE
jgi:hypothetical protein